MDENFIWTAGQTDLPNVASKNPSCVLSKKMWIKGALLIPDWPFKQQEQKTISRYHDNSSTVITSTVNSSTVISSTASHMVNSSTNTNFSQIVYYNSSTEKQLL